MLVESEVIFFRFSKYKFQVRVQTAYGNIDIEIYGDRHKHPVLTFHDIGTNGTFLKKVLRNFSERNLLSILSKSDWRRVRHGILHLQYKRARSTRKC